MKKFRVVFTIALLVVTLVISFFVGVTYHEASTTEVDINESVDYIIEGSIYDVETIFKGQKNAITKQEAENLCRNILAEKAEETGFPISYRCIGATSANDKLYYVMHITWLVNNSHWSYIGNCFVSFDGREIYDGIVSQDKCTMTQLRWKK